MLLQKKKGFPEEDEIVICTVVKISPHSIFVRLDEYDKSGMIHISEVSPGRIRNIRDFVREGKVVVCKVLRVSKEKGYIDLSLRRVNEAQRKGKVNAIKQEQKAEKIVEFVAKKLNRDAAALFNDALSRIEKRFDGLYSLFESVVEKGTKLEELGIAQDVAAALDEAVRQRIKPIEVTVAGNLSLRSFEPDGVEAVKKALKAAESSDSSVAIRSLGGGNYRIAVKAHDYKSAEKVLDNAVEKSISVIEKSKGSGDFVKVEVEK